MVQHEYRRRLVTPERLVAWATATGLVASAIFNATRLKEVPARVDALQAQQAKDEQLMSVHCATQELQHKIDADNATKMDKKLDDILSRLPRG